ncbi:MAG: hypothetical protein GY719_26410 [bacterium]|nr:hypothetical protein [bacterium]
MRELEPLLPEGAERVLDRPKYWDPRFFELFLEYAEELIYREPRFGLRIAETVLRLGHALPEEENPAGQRERQERLARAHGLVGVAYRVLSLLYEAEAEYRTALRFCRNGGVSRTCRADLLLKLAVLRGWQKRFDEALKIIAEVEGSLTRDKDESWLGRVYATRGAIYVRSCNFSEAVGELSKALGQCRLTRRVEYSATANLAYAVSETDDPRCLEIALGHLKRARQLAGPRRSVEKSTFFWIEGRIFVRRGSTERAEHKYRKALEGFVKFQTPYEIALVSLDLSSLLRFSKRWAELEELAAETYSRFRDLQEDTEALASLKLWLDAAQARTLSIEQISEIKAAFVERMRGQGVPSRAGRRR